jgi:hypothetical protein
MEPKRAIHLRIDLISEELVAKMHDRNVRIHAADVNLKHEIARAYELGVDQLSTDRTRRGFATSHSPSRTSTPSLPACEPAALNSSASWSATRTATGSATSAARRESSSS